MPRLGNALCAMVLCTLTGCIHYPPNPDMSRAVSSLALSGVSPTSTTVPIQIDDRLYVEVAFIRPDGSTRKALAFVNMGSVPLILSNDLFRELQPKPGAPLHMQLGSLDIAVDGATVEPEDLANSLRISINPFAEKPTAEALAKKPSDMAKLSAPMKVEAILPAGVLQHFDVVFDYGARTMTLATPGSLKPEGTPVPVRVNPKTGFVMLDAKIAGRLYPMVLDIGGSYGGARDTASWTEEHPNWLRSIGGIGPANLVMGPEGDEVSDPVLKIPSVSFGPLTLDAVGLEEIGPQSWFGRFATQTLFWDGIYSAKAGETVDGWIGGDVLKSFRLTIAYRDHMTYWLQQAPIDTHNLEQVGLVLSHMSGVTTVAGIAQKDGKPTVTGVMPGDKLLQIDGVETASLTRGGLIAALHGMPGTQKHLVLERDGKKLERDAVVTAF